MKDPTKSSHNHSKNFTPSHGTEGQTAQNRTPNNYYHASGSSKPNQQQLHQSQPKFPPQLSAHSNMSNNNQKNTTNCNKAMKSNNSNNNNTNNNMHQSNSNNDVTFSISSYIRTLNQMDSMAGQKSANTTTINAIANANAISSKTHTLDSKNNNRNTTTSATVPDMLLVRPAFPSSLHIGTFPFLPVQFF
ncbi:probable WRKY transcription factor protein 1 [Drosophila madeirensis]|uniref:Probable WRKY transcription factor protein 1 n=1 Tax=Drosophila madeirensis TaxID=30013 RepID=A0AAU9G7Y2_DROMD